MTLSDYIRQNSTVTDFAKAIGKSRAQVHRYMLGHNLSKDVIERISAATGGQVQPSDFFAAEPARVEDAVA